MYQASLVLKASKGQSETKIVLCVVNARETVHELADSRLESEHEACHWPDMMTLAKR